MRVIVHISSGALVGVVREAHEGSGGVSTRNCACIHFTENHTGGLDEADGGVNGKEFTGRAGAESIGIIHAKAIRDPIVLVAREFGELVGVVRSGRK